MTNDQASARNVLETSLDLIKQILVKHETAVIAEFRAIIEAKNHELHMIYAERDAHRQAAHEADMRTQAAVRGENAAVKECEALKMKLTLERIDQGKQRDQLMTERDKARDEADELDRRIGRILKEGP